HPRFPWFAVWWYAVAQFLIWFEFFSVAPDTSEFGPRLVAQAVLGVVSALLVAGGVILWSRSLVWMVLASFNAVALLIGQFSIWYLGRGGSDDWNIPLTRLDALLVALGTFTTAGTSGITPRSEYARGLVTTQLAVGVFAAIVVFGLLVARLAARSGSSD